MVSGGIHYIYIYIYIYIIYIYIASVTIETVLLYSNFIMYKALATV